MNMKTFTCLLVTTLASSCANAQSPTQSTPAWTAHLKVMNEAGQPVGGAAVTIGYGLPSTPEQSTVMGKKTGLTDTNGWFIASEHSRSFDLEFSVKKSGYYETFRSYELGAGYDPARWNPVVTLVLKRVGQPIPMYAKMVREGPPIFDKSVGYDLAAGDWVAPYGKGQTTDLIFTHKRDLKSPLDYEYALTVSFPNAGDGIQAFAVPDDEQGSSLRSPREAPDGGYQREVTRKNVSHPPNTAQMDYDPNRNYFIRVRTVLDEKGNVKSAHYGKIYGDFMQFRYYLNPTPNDPNVEFDPARNLLTGGNVTLP